MINLLSQKRRIRIREISRQCFLDCKQDKAKSIERARRRIKTELGVGVVGMLLLGLMTQLAIKLITYWIVNQIYSPTRGAFMRGEPGDV